MTSSPIPNAKAKFWNRAGQPLAGGKLYTYVAGSVNTNKATYKDYNNTMTNTNPVILDAYGEADIWLDGIYKLNLTDSNDVAQWSVPIDNVSSINTTNTTYTTTGSGNAYILTPSPAITSYVGSSFTIIPNFTNTAPATININGLGVVNLTKNGSTALVANDLISGQFYTIAFDGINFQVTNLNSNFTSLTVTGLTTLADVKIIDSINDTNNNEVIIIGSVASAVNEITITNAATGNAPSSSATGDDTNIAYALNSKGTSGVTVNGSTLAVHGQCRLVKSGLNLVLLPFNGNNLLIGTKFYTIPSAGVSLAPSGLTSSTVYYIYAYMSGSTMTLEASTTGHSVDTTTGVEIKTGDATRTLVGMGWATGTTTWGTGNADVATWFNRRPVNIQGAFTADRSTTSTSFVELNSEIRTNFLTWGDAATTVASLSTTNNTTPPINLTKLSLDGSTDLVGNSVTILAGSGQNNAALFANYPTTEGRRYVTVFGRVTSGTGTWAYTSTVVGSGILQTIITI